MSEQQPAGNRPEQLHRIPRPIDLEALTAAVQRLLRRELLLARERRGDLRRGQ